MYSLSFGDCIFIISDVDGNYIKQYDLPTIEIFFDDQYFTIKDIDTEFKIHISELSGVDSGAYATFQDMFDIIYAEKVACASSSGGTETTTSMGALINSATSATPNNSDYVATAESGGALKKITWTNVKAFLKTYFDTTYTAINSTITGATKTKITYDSKGLVTSGADATTADIADSTNKRYVTDAQLVVIGNTSGTNSGNETTSTIGSLINGASSATPNDTDLVATSESSTLKKITWTSVKAFLKSYFDTIYTTTSAVASQITTAISGKEDASNKSNSYTSTSTSTYASSKALSDGLATRTRVVLKSITDGTTVTGTISDTLTYSGVISANTFATGDVIRFYSFSEFASGGTNNRRCRAYLNTSASLSGATLIASTPNPTSTTRTISFDRYLGIKSASVTRVHSSTALDYAGTTNSTNVWTTANIDWTVDQYFIISIQLGVGTDSGYSSFLILEKL